MNLKSIRVYSGRNIYSHWPVVRLDIDLGEYVDIPSCDIEGFNEKLLNQLPGLNKHKCSIGYEGGFCERLKRGTYLAHVVEHVALEIQNLLGYDIKFGKARYLENETIYCVVYSYIDEVAGYEAGKLAFDLIRGIIKGLELDIQKRLEEIHALIKSNSLGPSTAAIVVEAKKRKIPITRLDDCSLLQLGYGKYSRKIEATITDSTSCIAVDIACDKELSKKILRNFNIPVPDGKMVMKEEEALKVAVELGFPVVIKPHNGNQGRGVSLNLCNTEDVRKAFKIASEFSDKIIVEKYLEGKHYRIAVVGEKVVAVAERLAAHVVGNGVNTIEELIHKENKNPLRGEGHEKPLTKIKLDDITYVILEKQNISTNYIPCKDEIIYLRENANISTGGIAIDATDEIHPDNIRMAINATRIIGLDVAGIDLTIKDLSEPISISNPGAIIEINACPGIRMHHYPSKGKSRNVAREIVDMLYPEECKYTIPIVSVTGTNGKTTTSRMLAKILQKNNLVVGMASTGGVYIQDQLILEGDTTGPKSAKMVLLDNRVEVAVLETARGGIVNRGLGYDLADIGVITNIGDDHLGVDGINTLEDMADVKALVVEAIREGGYAILNAHDPYSSRIAQRIKCEIIYFAEDSKNKTIQKHIKGGGKAVYLSNNHIYIFDGEREIAVIDIRKIPATFSGVLKHNIENSMAAIAAAYGLGVEVNIIREALEKFKSDYATNPGRFNVFNFEKYKVIIDYGHNIDGYTKVLEGLKKMNTGRLVGVIGVPGDRTDISILKIGEIAGKYFDYVYIKEDIDLRGRMPEEVAKLMKKGCQMAGLTEDKIEIKLWEVEALRLAMENAQEGDAIIVFYEDSTPLVELINEFKEKQINKQVEPLEVPVAKAVGVGQL